MTPPADELPLPAVEILMGEIRRLNSRISVPETLYFVADGGKMRPVRIYVLADKELYEARLVDVSDDGLALTLAHESQAGDELEVIARCQDSDAELFRETVLVRNQRTARTGLADETVKNAMRVCGIQSADIGESPLYKAVLDSIFIEHLCDSKGISAYLTE